ncbi:TetR/AcrR family transcriptional regulator [Kineosporia succinea]|uniref:AcrR family transcriptional regulator n=1 Tax=Kineosporia succinea TaxID=84632 RepID=A0ABT9PGX1_9ACTN|nr:TetR/AcrR family transcriptional regulator [Kineosporia succinea]MDP9831185.1 AcrR family transcriptional regulator [Kineosporia succinea]
MPALPSDDPRYARTRQALLTALLELGDDDLAEVSVGLLARAAGVHRTSFYNHFTSLPEAAAAALGVGMHEIMREDASARRTGIAPEEAALATTRRTFEYLAGHRGLYLLASDWRSPSGLRGIADVLAQQLREYRNRFGAGQNARPEHELQAEDVYVASAVEGYYAAMLHDGLAVESGTASRLLYAMLPSWMRTPQDRS